jgi:hypothetical protein
MKRQNLLPGLRPVRPRFAFGVARKMTMIEMKLAEAESQRLARQAH